MKLLTLWRLVCCVALLCSGGSVDGLGCRAAHRRRQQHRSLNDQLRVDRISRTSSPDYWDIYTISNSNAQPIDARIIIRRNFIQTACPPWIRGVSACFSLYHETTNNKDAPPEITSATTELNDKIESTTRASVFTEMATEETVSIASRFDDIPKVDFNVYYNTTTGVDLNKVKSLRPPTIQIPPANHSNDATKTTNNEPSAGEIPGGSSIHKKEPNNEEKNVYSPVTITTRARRRTQTTPEIKLSTFPMTVSTPFLPKSVDQDQDSVTFNNAEEDLLFKQNRRGNTPKISTTARESLPTTIPLIPSTNGKDEHTRTYRSSTQSNQYDNPKRLVDEELSTEGMSRVLYEKRDKLDLTLAIKECCKRISISDCFESKGFNFDVNPCEPILRRGWNIS